MKFQSGLFITTLVFSQELNDDFQLKSNCFNPQNFERIVQNCLIVPRCVKCTKNYPLRECQNRETPQYYTKVKRDIP